MRSTFFLTLEAAYSREETKIMKEEHSIINRINTFLARPHYVVLIMSLTALANILELELPMYTLIALTAVYTLLFGKDILPLMPLWIAGYVTPSRSNTPGRNPESVFYGTSGIYIAGLAAVICAAFIIHIIRARKKIVKAKPQLLWGMLALLAVYLFSGIGSDHYAVIAGRNIFHALLQSAAILLPYLMFCVFVDWDEVRSDYFAWIGFCVGSVLCIEILAVYVTQEVIVDGSLLRDQIYTGWGMYNNMGGLLAMMIPFAFSLGTQYRKIWIGALGASLFLGCVFLTCSRSSILTAVLIYCVSGFWMLRYSQNRRQNILMIVSIVFVGLSAMFFFRKQLMGVYSVLMNLGLKLNNRDIVYREGWNKFLQSPILGTSFYCSGYKPDAWSTLESFHNVIPPRWHNTILQILVCCGVSGILAYLFHRLQTVKLFLRRANRGNTFIACSILALLISSMFDCHFFNIGPVLFYSMALSFAENCPRTTSHSKYL